MSKYILIALFFLWFPYDVAAQTTPDFTPEQHYLFDPSNPPGTGPGHAIGVGAPNVWAIPGATGAGITVADIEGGWHLNHEDLPGIQLIWGENAVDNHHGTAVLGIIAGQNNGFGITGICPDVTVKVSSRISEGLNDVPAAIIAAKNSLSEGDIILIEYTPSVPGTTYEVPAEYDSDSKAEIQNAVNEGIIVFEAAGNSGIDINDYLSGPHSGAIIVAAGQWDGLKAARTNWGDRVDVHASGKNLVTAGYGDRYDGGDPGNPNNNYTEVFGETSGASAVVAGVAASLQGIYYAATGQPLTPAQMRDILVESGIPHQNGGQNIGPRVSLPGAVNYLIDHYGLNLDRFLTVSAD